MTQELHSASIIVETQTRAIEREFKSSRPKPRGWAMGFEEEPRKRPGRSRRVYTPEIRDRLWKMGFELP